MDSPPTALTADADRRRVNFKPYDVEELFDDRINRPLARLLVRLLALMPVTANQVTILSGITGLVAGVLVGVGSPARAWPVPIGGALLLLSMVLDCADGQLARLRGTSSMFGRALDGYVDVVPTAAMFFGFAVFLYRAGYHPLYINALGWTAGYSLKWHVHAYDHAKNVYLRNVLPADEHAKNLTSIEDIAQERQRYLDRGDRFRAIVIGGYLRLTESQRRGWQGQRIGLATAAMRDDRERALYRDRFIIAMRVWSFNGLATHLALFLAATLVTPWYSGAAMTVWWIILVPGNLLTLCLRLAERRIERELAAELGREAA